MRCPGCGSENRGGARFCDNCGAILTAPRTDAVPTRRTITVLFSDLSGSTSLGERMDPESVRDLMSSVYAAMRDEVESRGGFVSKFTGDGLMAVFGVPDVQEDDAMRAVEASLGMLQRLDVIPADIVRDHGLFVKVGVNTGEIVFDSADEDIVGDCVNVAARLEGAAGPGEVIVGPETWRLTRSSLSYEPITPLTLKGKSEPVAAYRVTSVRPLADATGSAFVGRDDELAVLAGAFASACDARTAAVTTIIGAPGLGKTRLVREFGATVAGRARVIETRCSPAGSVTLAPMFDVLRTLADVDETAGPDAILDVLGGLVAGDDRDGVVARIAALLGAGEPVSFVEICWAVRRVLESSAQTKPLVLLLDDMHWAEPLLFELIEYLMDWTRTVPLHIVLVGRPELRDIRSSLAEPRSAGGVIALDGLDVASTVSLACSLLETDNVPDELLARLPASTDGNPLFVRELVRMLVDDGVLQRSDDAWVTTVDVASIEVPPTIQSLLSARVDRLGAAERTVLELASVVGKEFQKSALVALASAEVHDDLDAQLENLRRKELVEPAESHRLDEPVFRFHHALIRDAAYRRLLKGSRADLHERLARWLEHTTTDVFPERDELIGHHLEQAHESRRQLGPLDEHGHDLGRRGAAFLASAAGHALDRDDLEAAAGLCSRALDRLDDDDPARPEILIVQCEALLANGDVTTGAIAVRNLAKAASTPRLAAWATCFVGELSTFVDPSRLHETEMLVSAAANELAEAGDHAGAAKAHTVHAGALARLGRVGECEEALDAALTAAREAGDRRRITAVLGAAPPAALWGPSTVSRAGGRCLDVVRLLRVTTGSPAVEATSLRCQAVLEALRGRSDAARKMIASALHDLEHLGLRHGLLETKMFAGIVELTAGDPAAARSWMREAHDGFKALGVDVDAGRAAALLARTELALWNEREAEALTFESEELGGDDLKTAITWRTVRAEIFARQGKRDDALALAEAAVEIAGGTDALIDHGDACLALSAVRRMLGDVAGADAALEDARELYERKGAIWSGSDPATDEGAAAPARPAVESAASVADNAGASTTRRAIEAFGTRAWDEVAPLFSAETVWADHRPGLRVTEVGRRDIVANLQTMAEIGATHMEMTLLATRGERLALFHAAVTGDDPASFFATDLTLTQLDADGLISRTSIYEPDELGPAFRELDRLYLADEGADVADVWRIFVESVEAFVDRDWQRYADVLASDVSYMDHRLANMGRVEGREDFIHHLRTLTDLIPDLSMRAVAIDVIDTGRAVLLVEVTGTNSEGGPIEFLSYIVARARNGEATHVEEFPLEQRDELLTRYEEFGRF